LSICIYSLRGLWGGDNPEAGERGLAGIGWPIRSGLGKKAVEYKIGGRKKASDRDHLKEGAVRQEEE